MAKVKKSTKKKAKSKGYTAAAKAAVRRPRLSDKSPPDVQFEVVIQPESGCRSMFDVDALPTITNLDGFRTPRDKGILVARRLQRQGVIIHHIGDFSVSAMCTKKQFEKLFNTKLSEVSITYKKKGDPEVVRFAPPQGAPWKLPDQDDLDKLIERAYVQHEPVYFANERPLPPHWKDKFRLRVPVDVAQLLGAISVHRQDITGAGVRVAMCDTGFYHHPYFHEHGYNFLAVTAPDTIDHTTDSSGHGTGECANLFATAPDINFIGIKTGNPTLGIKTAVDLRPEVMTNSWGYNVDRPGTSMPNFLKPLHLAVLDAVAKGITVCFSAGNGHFGFPGSMPEVISAGGVVVDKDLNYSATKYASGFMSTWFPGRRVPDVCGLCGVPPTADYIILPVMSGAFSEKEDGWGAFSGTSASSPMVAGVCALLKQADPELTPSDIKNLLQYTARDITSGTNAHGKTAGLGPDDATGFGLVDATRAMQAIF